MSSGGNGTTILQMDNSVLSLSKNLVEEGTYLLNLTGYGNGKEKSKTVCMKYLVLKHVEIFLWQSCMDGEEMSCVVFIWYVVVLLMITLIPT